MVVVLVVLLVGSILVSCWSCLIRCVIYSCTIWLNSLVAPAGLSCGTLETFRDGTIDERRLRETGVVLTGSTLRFRRDTRVDGLSPRLLIAFNAIVFKWSVLLYSYTFVVLYFCSSI